MSSGWTVRTVAALAMAAPFALTWPAISDDGRKTDAARGAPNVFAPHEGLVPVKDNELESVKSAPPNEKAGRREGQVDSGVSDSAVRDGLFVPNNVGRIEPPPASPPPTVIPLGPSLPTAIVR